MGSLTLLAGPVVLATHRAARLQEPVRFVIVEAALGRAPVLG